MNLSTPLAVFCWLIVGIFIVSLVISILDAL